MSLDRGKLKIIEMSWRDACSSEEPLEIDDVPKSVILHEVGYLLSEIDSDPLILAREIDEAQSLVSSTVSVPKALVLSKRILK